MERVYNATQLKVGDKIVRVAPFTGSLETLEFIGPHPHNKKYSLFIDGNYDGIPKFYNPRFAEEKWYLFHGTPEEWNEALDMRIAYHEKEIEHIKEYKEKYIKP